MIKMTIVTDPHGKLIGAVNGHTLVANHGDVQAQVSFTQGHKLHKIEVENDLDMTKITDAAGFQDRLLSYLPKS